MKFYIASHLDNAAAVSALAAALGEEGHVQTYDWTTHGQVWEPPEGRAARMAQTAEREVRGVAEAEAFILLFPGGGLLPGLGSHTELGLALAWAEAAGGGRRVLLAYDHPSELVQAGRGFPSVFYSHRRIEHCRRADVVAALGPGRQP